MPRPVDHRVTRARQLRRNPTDAGHGLRQGLRPLRGIARFRRQATIGSFVADFARHSHRPIIGLAGGRHGEGFRDAARPAGLEAKGYRIFRFRNSEVLANIDGTVEAIASAVNPLPPAASRSPTPDPSPPRARGEGK